jgi:hypothetical protein
MRIFLSALLLVFAVSTFASAELLVTGNPIGQGKWAFMVAGVQDANVQNSSGMSLTTIGGYVGYGITNKLDVFGQVGSSNMTGLPLGVSKITATVLGLNLKYDLMDESASLPVTVAIGGGYRTLGTTTSVTGLGDINATNGQTSLGVGVSKIMAPYIPYAGLIYRSTASAGNAVSTQIDATIGVAIAWSMQGAVYVEDTLQSITPNGGSAYSSNEIALAVGYKI